MPDEKWPCAQIKDLIQKGWIRGHKDGNYGSSYPRVQEFGKQGVPFLTAKLLDDAGNINLQQAPRLRQEVASKLTYGFIEQDDVLLSHNATIGRVAVVPTLTERVLIGTSLTYFRVDRERLIPAYLAAYFSSREFQNQLNACMSHSTRNQVPITDQRELFVRVPPIAEQRRLAGIASSFNDKIELNRRMNETLEAMAQAIFKSWFVDFDPVRAKSEGLKPAGMDEATATLFPDSFQPSPIGRIPEGWAIQSLYNVATFVNGAAFKNEDFCSPGDGLPVIKIAELKEGVTAQTKWSLRAADPDQKINEGDLLYSWSGNPDTSLDAFLWSHGQGLLNQHIFKVITSTATQTRFVYLLLKFLRPVLAEIARDKQTTGLGHVTVADMKRLHVCRPSEPILSAFDSLVGPILEMSFLNTLQNQSLSKCRDTLLPKLLSGELVPSIS